MREFKLNKTRTDFIIKDTVNHMLESKKPHFMTYDEMVAKGIINEDLIKSYPTDFVVKHIMPELEK